MKTRHRDTVVSHVAMAKGNTDAVTREYTMCVVHARRERDREGWRRREIGERLTQGDHDDDAETCTRGCMGSPSRNEHPEPSRKSKPLRKKPCRCERRRNAEETEKKNRGNDPTKQQDEKTNTTTNERNQADRNPDATSK